MTAGHSEEGEGKKGFNQGSDSARAVFQKDLWVAMWVAEREVAAHPPCSWGVCTRGLGTLAAPGVGHKKTDRMEALIY